MAKKVSVEIADDKGAFHPFLDWVLNEHSVRRVVDHALAKGTDPGLRITIAESNDTPIMENDLQSELEANW